MHAGHRFWIALVSTLLSACASVPDDAPVVEKLDTDTGLTVARLGQAVELYRESGAKDASGKFAFLGPFETNQMGSRELYLWIAIPAELPEGEAPPIVEIDGKPVALGAPGRSPDFAGLHKSPYKIPTPWSSNYFYRVDGALVDQLGAATELGIRFTEPTRDGSLKSFFTVKIVADERLKEFAARD
jgi:hypothetical protein